MAEAQPSKRRGGHAHGRRNENLSNAAEEGELCIYTGTQWVDSRHTNAI